MCGLHFCFYVYERILERPRCRWEDNIKTYLKYIRRDGMDCFELAQHRDKERTVLNIVMLPSCFIN